MNRQNGISVVIAIIMTMVAVNAGASNSGTVIEFSSLDKTHDHDVRGTLYLPDSGSPPYPAIVMVHGTAGIDEVGALYRQWTIAIPPQSIKRATPNGTPTRQTILSRGWWSFCGATWPLFQRVGQPEM